MRIHALIAIFSNLYFPVSPCRLVEAQCSHTSLLAGVVAGILRSLQAPASALASARKEVASAQQSTVDAAAARWSAMLHARQAVHRWGVVTSGSLPD